MSTLPTDPIPARAATYAAVYPMLLRVAQEHGYALTVHGSLHRDFDLVAIPWVVEASDPITLIRAMRDTIGGYVCCKDIAADDEYLARRLAADNPAPHGRMQYVIHLTPQGPWGGYLDISVMPMLKVEGNTDA